MDAIDRVASCQVPHDSLKVVNGGGSDRRRVEAFELASLRACPPGELADVGRAVDRDLRDVLRDLARHHQPLGVPVDEVIARNRQVDRARHQVDVDPGVHPKSRSVR